MNREGYDQRRQKDQEEPVEGGLEKDLRKALQKVRHL